MKQRKLPIILFLTDVYNFINKWFRAADHKFTCLIWLPSGQPLSDRQSLKRKLTQSSTIATVCWKIIWDLILSSEISSESVIIRGVNIPRLYNWVTKLCFLKVKSLYIHIFKTLLSESSVGSDAFLLILTLYIID